ncbi:TAXI family TRAP transporter solute-binding subunit [Actinophytocola sp.]|uniref:TAXI family TRAP transporter solute-binding subunit n=1 Tax=Actinophytocola sp. TaxID=1872138 RepID=UPI003D6A757C
MRALTMRAQRIVAGVVAVGLVAAGCGGKRPTESADSGSGGCEAAEGRVTIATGNTGGVYYTLGGGLAQLISDETPIKASAAETGASVQNIQQLVTGDYDIAFSLADSAADAVEGKGGFEGEKQDITALARIYSNYTQVVVRADSGIESVADMRGKKISTGSPKSGTEVIANRLLEAAGLDPASDVSAQRLALRQTVDQMKTGQIDGFVWSGGLPTPEVTDLTTSMKDGVRFVDITGLLPQLREINPVYEEGTLPADTYGLAEDVPSVVVPNVLLVRSDFPDGDACAITNLIFDQKGELAKVHKAANELDRETAVETDPVPLHPGAKEALGTD